MPLPALATADAGRDEEIRDVYSSVAWKATSSVGVPRSSNSPGTSISCCPAGVASSLTQSSLAIGRVSNKPIQIGAAHGKVILAIVQRCMLFPLKQLWVLLVVRLIKLVLRRPSVAMQTVAPRGQSTGAELAAMVLLCSL